MYFCFPFLSPLLCFYSCCHFFVTSLQAIVSLLLFSYILLLACTENRSFRTEPDTPYICVYYMYTHASNCNPVKLGHHTVLRPHTLNGGYRPTASLKTIRVLTLPTKCFQCVNSVNCLYVSTGPVIVPQSSGLTAQQAYIRNEFACTLVNVSVGWANELFIEHRSFHFRSSYMVQDRNRRERKPLLRLSLTPYI